MKVVILAGGFGTRLSEYTDLLPKPMVTIGGKPMLWHIMSLYSRFGFNDFVIALGYKSEYIKEYFLNFYAKNSDFTINLEDNTISYHKYSENKWKVTLVDTGFSTMTGGRVKRLKPFLEESDNFMMTYGDGLSDVNISQLRDFHASHNKLATVTSVRPNARFGELSIDIQSQVTSLQEKPQVHDGWINGGFFVFRREFLSLIDDDHTILEKSPLMKAAMSNELMAFKHEGFWQCMDTKRDRDYLNQIWDTGNTPWLEDK